MRRVDAMKAPVVIYRRRRRTLSSCVIMLLQLPKKQSVCAIWPLLLSLLLYTLPLPPYIITVTTHAAHYRVIMLSACSNVFYVYQYILWLRLIVLWAWSFRPALIRKRLKPYYPARPQSDARCTYLSRHCVLQLPSRSLSLSLLSLLISLCVSLGLLGCW